MAGDLMMHVEFLSVLLALPLIAGMWLLHRKEGRG